MANGFDINNPGQDIQQYDEQMGNFVKPDGKFDLSSFLTAPPTPSIETGALNGITRSLVLEVCKNNKIRVIEDEFEPGSIIFPEAMFITNAVRGIVEVSNLNNTTQSTRTQNLYPIIKRGLLELLEWT